MVANLQTQIEYSSAIELWDKLSGLPGLLIASMLGKEKGDDKYVWDAAAMLYMMTIGETMTAIPPRHLEDTIWLFLNRVAEIMGTYADMLIFGKIPILEWERRMTDLIIKANVAAVLAAVGGRNAVNDLIRAEIYRIVNEQLGYLRRFKEDILMRKQPLDGRLRARAMKYASSAYANYQNTRSRVALLVGYTMERRVLGIAEHCADCIRYANMGWQPIGTLPRIGESLCRMNCKCHFEYK